MGDVLLGVCSCCQYPRPVPVTARAFVPGFGAGEDVLLCAVCENTHLPHLATGGHQHLAQTIGVLANAVIDAQGEVFRSRVEGLLRGDEPPSGTYDGVEF